MYGKFKDFLAEELSNIEAAGLYKKERIITTPQRADIKVNAGEDVLNFCANNYLGLSDNKRLIEAAKSAMDTHGYGMSSVRFICGTQDLHKQLEAAISDYFKTEDTILYAACFDANGGLFEPLLTEEDAIISDALNHASIIDGVRLCKAKRYRYANADMADLERCLQEAQAQRFRIIATDGVFSMDGNVAPMDKICDLAEKYDALVMVDESHSAGVVGPTGHGVAEQFGVYGRVDIFTGTLGKAFGGAMGGFTTGRKEIIDMLRQRSRPYLFSNSVAPAIIGASLEMFKMLKESNALHDKLMELGAKTVLDTIEAIFEKKVELRLQKSFIQGSEVLKPAPKLSRELCHIDWNRPAKEICNLIRGLSPYPAAFTELEKDGKTLSLKIFEAEKMTEEALAKLKIASGTADNSPAGTIISDGKEIFAILTSDGAIALKDIQMAGKKRMAAKDFLIGFREPWSYSVTKGTSSEVLDKYKKSLAEANQS